MLGLDIPSIIVGALVSGFIAVAVTRHYATKKKLCSLLTINEALAPEPDSLPSQVEIRFGMRVISNLYRLDLAVWNGGNREIRSSDLIESDEITVHVKNADLLELAHLEGSGKTVNASAKIRDPQSLGVKFNTFNQKDFVIITALLEKTSDKPIECSVMAAIAGAPDGVEKVTNPDITSWNDLAAYLALVVIFGIGAFAAAAEFIEILNSWPAEFATEVAAWVGLGSTTVAIVSVVQLVLLGTIGIVAGIFAIFGASMVLLYRTRLPHAIRSHFGISSQFYKFRKAVSKVGKEITS